MPLFRSKPKVVDAVQFTDEANPPRGVIVSLFAIGSIYHVITKQNQQVRVNVGEWIVDEGDSKHSARFTRKAHIYSSKSRHQRLPP